MRALVIADLRHSIRIWAGSLLVLAVSQLGVMCVTGMMSVGLTNVWMITADDARLPVIVGSDGSPLPADVVRLLPAGLITATAFSFVILVIVTSITVRNVVNAIIFQRRRVIALWQLAGMTDAQMMGILRAQIAVLATAALLVSAAVALPITPWTLDLLREARLLVTPSMTTSGIPLGYLVGAVVGVLVCVFAVRGASRELAAIDPLEAIRSEGVRELPMTRRRWIGVIVWGGLGVAAAAGTLATTEPADASLSGMVAGMLGIVAFSVGGPVLIVRLLSAWTRVVPEHVSASWFLARKTLTAATARSVSTVGSISIAVYLFTTTASQQTANGGGTDTTSFVLLVGFPLAISLAGSVVLVFMSGQQREREIRLAELAGATPAQQARQAFFEALIVVVTGSAIGLALSLVMVAVTQPSVIAATGAGSFTIAWGHVAAIAAVLLVLNAVATVVPTLIAQAGRDRIALAA